MNSPAPQISTEPSWARMLVVAGLIVVALLGVRTIATPDIWIHLASGQWTAKHGLPQTDPFSFTRDQATWVNASPLYDGLVYRLWGAGGAAALTLAHVAVVVAAFWLLLPAARRWGGSVPAGLALIVGAWLAAPQLDSGPMAFGLFFVALFVFVLDCARPAWLPLAVLIPAQILWTNIHASFLLGPAICLLYAIQTAIAERAAADSAAAAARSRRVVLALVLAGCALVVTLFNPAGFGLLKHVVQSWANPAYDYVQEWVSPFSDQFRTSTPQRTVYLALAISAGGLVTLRRRLPIVLTTLAIVSAFLVVRSLRYTALFGVLGFPFLCLSLSSLGEFLAAKLPARTPALGRSRLLRIAAAVVVLAAIASGGAVMTNGYYVGIGSASSFGLGVVDDLFPAAALDHLVLNEEFPERALNLIPDGGYLAWRAPGRKVFVDQRAALYGTAFYKTMIEALLRGEQQSLDALIEQWGPGAAIINACTRNAHITLRTLLMGGHWGMAYFDGTTAVLLLEQSAHASLLNNPAIHAAGLQTLQQDLEEYRGRLGNLRRPPVPPRLVGAGSILLTLGRYEEAEAIYAVLVRGAPNMAAAWLSLGICQTQLGKAAQAVETLGLARDRLPGNALTWLWLSRACALSGAADDARAAFERGKKINAATAEAFGDPLK